MKTTTTFIAAIATMFLIHAAKADPKADVQLFVSGEKAVFDSTGHEKAKGVRVKLFYPKTWKAIEGARPNIIQKLVSENGTGMAMVMLQTRALPPELNRQLTDDEKKELIGEDSLKELVPDGGKLVSYKLTKLEGEPCGMLETSMIAERAGFKIAMFNIFYVVPVKGAILIIQTGFGGNATDGVEALEARYREAKPILQLIAGSCIFPDKWEKK